MDEEKYYKYMPCVIGYSNCCSGTVLENSDICNTCGEHCEVQPLEDCDYEI